MRPGRACLCLLALLLAGCGSRSPFFPWNSNGRPDGSLGPDAAVHPDAGPPDAAVGPDAGDPCECAPGEVYRNHNCVPTREMGCSQPCDPVLEDCGEWQRCDPCGAASSCAEDDCLPACVSDEFYGPPIEQGDLRISPTVGPAGQPAVITIHGHPMFTAAMFYLVWLGEEETVELSSDSHTCSHVVQAGPHAPATYPVWVSQYGGGGPNILAGFFTFSSGDLPSCVQPGYPCALSTDCCQSVEAPVTCSQSRCTLLEPP